jgi:hypothetical protein
MAVTEIPMLSREQVARRIAEAFSEFELQPPTVQDIALCTFHRASRSDAGETPAVASINLSYKR